MNIPLARRSLMTGLVGGTSLIATARFPLLAQGSGLRLSASDRQLINNLNQLEARSGGRLGVTIFNTASGRAVGINANQRFAFCSTFKLPLAAMTLEALEQERLPADRLLPITQADLITYAPITSKSLEHGGMSAKDLAEAAVIHSDNVAANILLDALGGPQAFTSWVRTQGDDVTRLDDKEPALNSVPADTVENTSTPAAMARLYAGLLGDKSSLSLASRHSLKDWLIECQTGLERLRAGLPQSWTIGDKTGTASAALTDRLTAKVNDIAVIWHPDGHITTIAAFYEIPLTSKAMPAENDAVLAQVGQIAHQWIENQQ